MLHDYLNKRMELLINEKEELLKSLKAVTKQTTNLTLEET
jgi:hypothetical protein